jgi:hypothetical protein
MIILLVLMVDRSSAARLMLTHAYSMKQVSFMLIAFITYCDVCELEKYYYINLVPSVVYIWYT